MFTLSGVGEDQGEAGECGEVGVGTGREGTEAGPSNARRKEGRGRQKSLVAYATGWIITLGRVILVLNSAL